MKIQPMTNTANLSETAKSSAPKVHLFNPANDEALASNNRWHTPSRHALQYQHDCELLPIWWADDGDYIIAPHHTDAEIEATSRKANVKVKRHQVRMDFDYQLERPRLTGRGKVSLTVAQLLAIVLPLGWAVLTALLRQRRQQRAQGACAGRKGEENHGKESSCQ